MRICTAWARSMLCLIISASSGSFGSSSVEAEVAGGAFFFFLPAAQWDARAEVKSSPGRRRSSRGVKTDKRLVRYAWHAVD